MTSASGLMAFWSDIDDDYLLRYQEWHNCEHMPERVSIPGFLTGRRYRATDGRAHFLMLYETMAPETLGSQPYLAALNAPTPWTREALTHFREPVRNVYRLAGAAGRSGAFPVRWMTSVRFNLPATPAEESLATWLDAITTSASVNLAQVWRVDEEVSMIMTSERKIYSGGPGQQQYLLLLGRNRPADAKDTPLQDADAAASAWAGREHEIAGDYWLEMIHYALQPQGAPA